MNLIQYVVWKFNQEADLADKIKVNLLTIFDTGISTVLSVQGLVSIFDINTKSLWAYLALMVCGIGYFQLFRVWHIGRIIRGVEADPPKNPNAKA